MFAESKINCRHEMSSTDALIKFLGKLNILHFWSLASWTTQSTQQRSLPSCSLEQWGFIPQKKFHSSNFGEELFHIKTCSWQLRWIFNIQETQHLSSNYQWTSRFNCQRNYSPWWFIMMVFFFNIVGTYWDSIKRWVRGLKWDLTMKRLIPSFWEMESENLRNGAWKFGKLGLFSQTVNFT